MRRASTVFTAEQVRAARAMARIGQAALAQKSGVSLETIKRIEGLRGPVETNASTHEALLKAFAELSIEFESYGPRGAGVRWLPGGVEADGKRDERRALERQALEPRALLPIVVDSSALISAGARPPAIAPSIVSQWSRDLRCRYANDGYLEWFGHSVAEMVGRPIQSLMGTALFTDHQTFIHRVLSGVTQTFERTVRKPSGAVGHTLVRYLPDWDSTGEVAGFQVIAADITPLKTAEINLAKAEAVLRETRRQVEAALQINMDAVASPAAERIAERGGPVAAVAGEVRGGARRGSGAAQR